MRASTRTWVAAAALTALTFGAAGCGGDDDGDGSPKAEKSFAAGTTMAKIHDKGKIVIGTKFDQPLYGEKQLDGSVKGFDVSIGRLLADELGVEAEFVEAVSKNREPFIQNGTVDVVIATYTINDTRKEKVDFAGPYYETGQSVMVLEDNTTINGKDDLAGKKVCSVEGSTPAQRIKEQVPTAAITLFDTYGKCAEALKNKQVDAVTTDEAILLGLISKNEGEFKVVGEQFSVEPYGIGLKKGDTAFRDFINDFLEEIYDNGKWKEALEDTVGKVQDDLPEPPAVNRY